MDTKNDGIYGALIDQLDKLARHNRQGSFRTKDRYYEAMKRFCRYLADEYHLQKLSNISGKHLTAYVLKLQSTGKSASTIKTDLSAIRFFHDKMDAKYLLPSNAGFTVPLERRRFGEEDRAWSSQEFFAFCEMCGQKGRPEYAAIAAISYYAGLRIHECFRLDTAAAEAAIRTGVLTVKGKGGRIRSVPIGPVVADVLRLWKASTPRGHKLFVPDGMPTDQAIEQLQQFIIAVRPVVSDRPITHHGLRHSYAVRQYQELMAAGSSEQGAFLRVSNLLGHGRPEITKIYLAGIMTKQ